MEPTIESVFRLPELEVNLDELLVWSDGVFGFLLKQ